LTLDSISPDSARPATNSASSRTERLDVEHRIFLHQLDDVAELVRAGAAPATWQALTRALARVLCIHISLEEHLVFPALAEARPEWAGFLHELESEHRRIERLARDAEHDATGVTALEWVDFLREHTEKETCVAFPLAEEALPAARLRQARVDLVAGFPLPRRRFGSDWPEHWLG
jgi:hemerythrin-like domain-containing protein